MLSACGLRAEAYTLGQLRFDPRQMKAHGLVERLERSSCCRLTPKGIPIAVMFLLFHKRLCGPLAHGSFGNAPAKIFKPRTKIQAAYRQADLFVQRLVDLLAAG